MIDAKTDLKAGPVVVDWYKCTPEQKQMLRDERKFVPHNVFQDVRKWSNTPTADFLLTRLNEDGDKEFLLTQRVERPWAGEYFIPGGRIPAGYRAEQGCQINCKRELGFIPQKMRFVGDYSILNPECQHAGDPYFTLMNLFEVEVADAQADAIKLDLTAKKMTWFTHIEDDFPQPMKEILTMFGFAERQSECQR